MDEQKFEEGQTVRILSIPGVTYINERVVPENQDHEALGGVHEITKVYDAESALIRTSYMVDGWWLYGADIELVEEA